MYFEYYCWDFKRTAYLTNLRFSTLKELDIFDDPVDPIFHDLFMFQSVGYA